MIRELVLRLRGVVDSSAGRLGGTLSQLTRAAAIAAAALSAVGSAIGALVIATAHAVDEIAKGARQLGLSAVEYQTLALAADLAGASMEHISVATAGLQRQMAAAGRGGKEAASALRAVGLSADDATRPMSEVFASALDGLRAIPAGAQRSAASMLLMGEAGARLASLIEGGSAGIRAARLEIEGMGTALSDAQAQGAERMIDSVTILRARVQGLSYALGLRLMPVAQRVLDWLDRVSSAALPRMIDGLDRMAGWVSANSEGLTLLAKVIGVTLAGGAIMRGGAMLLTLARGAMATVGAMGGLRVVLATAGRSLMVLGRGLLVSVAPMLLLGLAIDDLITFARGGDSAIGRLLDTLGGAGTAEEFRGLLSDIGTMLESAGAAALASLPSWESVVGVLTSIRDTATEAYEAAARFVGLGSDEPASVGLEQEELGVLGRARRAVQSASRGFRQSEYRSEQAVNATINVQGVTGEQVAQHIRREVEAISVGAMSQAGP